MQNDEISGDTVAIYINLSSLSITEALYCFLFLLLIFSRKPNSTIAVYVKLQNWVNHRAHVKDSQNYGVSSSHKEGWVLKNWCFWTVNLEKTLEESLGLHGDQPINSKGNQYWTFIGGTDAKTEAPIFWPPDVKSWLIGKDPDAGKDWSQEEKEMRWWGWEGWMASPTQWTWVWASSGRRWRAGKPGVLQSMGSQRVRHNWATETYLTYLKILSNTSEIYLNTKYIYKHS